MSEGLIQRAYVPCGSYVPLPLSTSIVGKALLEAKVHGAWMQLGIWVYAGLQPIEGNTWHAILVPNPDGAPLKIFCESQLSAEMVVSEHNVLRSLGDPDAYRAMMDSFLKEKNCLTDPP